MVCVKLKDGCSGRYLSELESLISSIDRKAISIQPCISDEGYMVRYPPVKGLGELDFDILCKLIRILDISRIICSPKLRVGRIDDGNVALTFTYDGGLTIQRVRVPEDATSYALRGFRIILLASRCRLCGSRVFECMIGLCGVCLDRLEYDESEMHTLSEDIHRFLSSLVEASEDGGLGGVERCVEDQLKKISRMFWSPRSTDEFNIAILHVSIILSLMNLYSKIRNNRELRKIVGYISEIRRYDDIRRIVEDIARLYREKML
jgi:hypothetical protein